MTLTATVSGGSGTIDVGTVGFLDGATQLGSLVPVSGGQATLTYPSLGAGTHTITAVYNGYRMNILGSASGPVTVTVAPAPLAITADGKSMPYGGPLPTLTASYSGFVNGDTPASLTTPPNLSTAATATSHAAFSRTPSRPAGRPMPTTRSATSAAR